MPADDPLKFDKDVFPAELTEIYRRRWTISRDHPLEDGKPEALPAPIKEFDEAEKKLHDAEKPAPLARAIDAILGWVRAILPKGKIKQHVTSIEDIRADVQIKRRALAAESPPSVRHGLIGLAFSGGGIRSATFNLGILQSLADLGILRFFDYLSTVSGGGYIGSWFSAWIWHERNSSCGGFGAVETQLKPALSARKRGEAKCPPIATVGEYPPQCGPDPIFHLRRYSNYLTPRLGAFSQDTWSAIAIYVRNLLLIQLMLIPALAAVLLLPRLLVKAFFEVPPEFCLWIPALALLIAVLIVLVSISSALNRLKKPQREHFRLLRLQFLILAPAIVASLIFSWLFGAQKNHLPKLLEPASWFLQVLPDVNVYASAYWGLALGLLNVAVYLICVLCHEGEFRGVRIFSDFLSGLIG